MAVKWHIVAQYSNGSTIGVTYATDKGLEDAVQDIIIANMKLLKFELLESENIPDYPPVPTPLEVEHERWMIDAEREMENFDSLQMEKRWGA
jgi:hypothetical protein